MKYTSYALDNGLKVVFANTEAFPSMTALLLIGAGSRYENTKNNGIAHFFEHMAFKGTTKYPNAFSLSSLIEGLGGEFNAFTDKDYTGYYVKGPSQHIEDIIDVLGDMIQHPLLDEGEIQREKGVIVQEINMYEDLPQRKVFSLFEEILYKGTSLGMTITGTAKTVNSFNRKTFTEYMNELYFANNSVLIISGALKKDIAHYKKVIEEKFSMWPSGKISEIKPLHENQEKPVTYTHYKKSEQAHLCFGYRAFSRFDERKYALTVLSAVLGRGMSSRLFTEVREKRGLCYSIGTYTDLYHDVGNILTYAGVEPNFEKLNEALKVIYSQHIDIVHNGITDDELTRAKELVKGSLLLSVEDTFNLAVLYGKQILLENKVRKVDEIISLVDKVTKDEVEQVAKDVFKDSSCNITVIGPFKESIDFDTIKS